MRFSTQTLAALLASPLLAFAANANPFTNMNLAATAGKTVDLTWTPTTSGTVSLILRSGANNNLTPGVYVARKCCCFEDGRLANTDIILQRASPTLVATPGLSPATSPVVPTTLSRSSTTPTPTTSTTPASSSLRAPTPSPRAPHTLANLPAPRPLLSPHQSLQAPLLLARVLLDQ